MSDHGINRNTSEKTKIKCLNSSIAYFRQGTNKVTSHLGSELPLDKSCSLTYLFGPCALISYQGSAPIGSVCQKVAGLLDRCQGGWGL